MIAMLFAAALAATPAALDQTKPNPSELDLRCYAGAIVLAGLNEDDEETSNAAAMLAFYYLGRLEGREPGIDWIVRGIEVGNAEGEELLGELVRCGAEFEAKGKELMTKADAYD